MAMRLDALAGAAEGITLVEQLAASAKRTRRHGGRSADRLGGEQCDSRARQLHAGHSGRR